jgi:hypothetical protein
MSLNEAKFTKGPWTVSKSDVDDFVIVVADGGCVCVVENNALIGINDKANAHLIAAAPALYEALRKAPKLCALKKELDDYIEGGKLYLECIGKIDAIEREVDKALSLASGKE